MTAAIDLCVDWVKKGEPGGGEFAGITRNLDTGEWSLTGELAGIALQSGLTIDDINTIRVVDGNTILYAGYVAPIDSGTGGLTIDGTGTGRRYTLAGPDLWAILAARLTYPTPATDPPWSTGFDERVGVASTVAAAYINANLGSGALVARRYPGVTVFDHTAGIIGSWSGRLQPLDKLIQRICREGGITCRLSVDFAGALRVDLVPARDRTTTTVLSDQGDLVNIRRRRVAAAANYIVSGGQGLLNARTFRTAGTAAGGARIELFSDQQALSTAAELQQSSNATLAANGANWSIHAELSTVAAQQLAAGSDYDLGDTIAAEIDNVRYPLPVSAVTVTVTPTEKVVRPVLGDAIPDLLGGLLLDVANLQARFDTNIA